MAPSSPAEGPSGLRLDGLVKRWEGGALAVDGVTLEAEPGELVTVVGPSGSGKSTLLRLIAGLEAPDAGGVRIGGREVTGVSPARRGVAMVFQNFALFPHLSVEENVAFGLVSRKVARDERDRRVAEVAERLGIGDLLERRPRQLSGGERQRVALARGLVGRPAVLLLDEPLSNLDAQLRAEARAEIVRVQRAEGITMLYVTHDQSEALAIGSRVAVLRAGRVEQFGTPAAVYDRPANSFVGAFLGSPPMTLVEGRVRDGAIGAGGVTVPVPPGAQVGDGEAIVAGIRPEAIRLGGGEGFPARVELVELVGHEEICHLVAGDIRLAARAPRGSSAAAGTEVRVRLDAREVRLFDAQSGGAR